MKEDDSVTVHPCSQFANHCSTLCVYRNINGYQIKVRQKSQLIIWFCKPKIDFYIHCCSLNAPFWRSVGVCVWLTAAIAPQQGNTGTNQTCSVAQKPRADITLLPAVTAGGWSMKGPQQHLCRAKWHSQVTFNGGWDFGRSITEEMSAGKIALSVMLCSEVVWLR